MILTDLHLYQFRNIAGLNWRPHPRINLLLGPNAQGKTNLLEAIFLLGTTKSLRQAGDEEMIMANKPEALVKGEVQRENPRLSRNLEVHLSRQDKKVVRLNGKNLSRFSQIIGQLSVVLFTPEDLDLVKAGPTARRFYLDLEISQASPSYLQHLQVFQRVLKQRNAALKWVAEGKTQLSTVEAFDAKLIEAGAEVVLFRLKAIEELQPLVAQMQKRISGGNDLLRLGYKSSLAAPGETLPQDLKALLDLYRRQLRQQSREEQARATTLVGPHRDDLEIFINQQAARGFASQGQQRTAALALKLAETQFLRERLGENPVLLLDDVLSELDAQRQRFLLDLLDEKVQTFITSTHTQPWPFQPGQILEAKQGEFKVLSAE